MATEIAAPRPDLGAEAIKKYDFEDVFTGEPFSTLLHSSLIQDPTLLSSTLLCSTLACAILPDSPILSTLDIGLLSHFSTSGPASWAHDFLATANVDGP